MQYQLKDAKRCLELLIELDAFELYASGIFKKGEAIVVDDLNRQRVMARYCWQSNPQFIEKFIAASDHLTHDDIEVVRGWKGRVREDYTIIKYYSKYAVFYSHKCEEYYVVVDLIKYLKKVFPFDPPILLKVSLLPYKGKIIWDGLSETKMIEMGRNLRKIWSDDFKKAKKKGLLKFEL